MKQKKFSSKHHEPHQMHYWRIYEEDTIDSMKQMGLLSIERSDSRRPRPG